MRQPYTLVDAFTREPYHGNPAAVVVVDDEPPDAWMTRVAAEFNLSETAFARRPESGEWSLRWFTPLTEVDLCGHATLATAHVLFDAGEVDGDVRFTTRSGTLVCRREGDAVAMDLPADPVTEVGDTERLAEALGAEVVRSGRGRAFLLAETADAAAVRSLAPDQARIAGLDADGVIATAVEDGRAVSRVFAPRLGIPEDPVTGAAHCTLAGWWAQRLGATFDAEQASARGGTMRVALRGKRVTLTGRAVTVARGELLA